MRGLVVAVALALGACTSFDSIKADWPKLKGQPIGEAVRRFGYPQEEQTILGAKVYTWRTSQPYVATSLTPSTTVATVGNQSVTATTLGTSSTGVTLGCQIRISTGPDDRIRTLEYDGSNLACAPYAEALRRD